MNYSILRMYRLFRMSFQAILSSKMRSFFVILSVGLSSVALTIIVAAVSAINFQIDGLMAKFGNDVIFIRGSAPRISAQQRTITVTRKDLQIVKNLLIGVNVISPLRSQRNKVVKYKHMNMDVAVVMGASAHFASVFNWKIEKGRDLSEDDILHARKVVLLGQDVVKKIFGDKDPIGETIIMQAVPLRVIGVLELRGIGGPGSSFDERIVIPISTLNSLYRLDINTFPLVRMRIKDSLRVYETKESLRSLLRYLHHLKTGDKDDFELFSSDEILKMISAFKAGIYLFLGMISMVTCVVGGFVLANLFYLCVQERQFEIGLKKALGANRRMILAQFIIESVTLSFLGGLLGLAIGVLFAYLVAAFGLFAVRISWSLFLISGFSSMAIGLIFGYLPAKKAADTNIITVLKGGL